MSSSLRSTLFLVAVFCYPTLALAQKSLAIFDEFADLFQENYAFFALRGVDWEQQKRIYRLVAMKGAGKIVIDVRFNGGGNDECALGFAERFTDKKRLAYSKETYSKGSYGSHLDLYVSPAGKTNNMAKVVVLTSRATASAAEMFVMAMMALPQVTILGEPTRGIHSDIYLKKLSNGWQVGLSNQKYILPNGKVHEKEGLPPHSFISFKGDVLEQGRDDLLERAIGPSR